jgi:hypothetical protein
MAWILEQAVWDMSGVWTNEGLWKFRLQSGYYNHFLYTYETPVYHYTAYVTPTDRSFL